MVSELNSFLQFIAAICFTITIDSSVFQRFWNADYYGIIHNCVNKYKVTISTPKTNDLDQFIKNHQKTIEAKGRREGAYLLLVICLFIIYGLFEPFFIKEECMHDLAISIILIYSFIVVSFTNWLKTWGNVLLQITITVIALITMTIILYKNSYNMNDHISLMSCQIIFRITLIVSIGIPISYRFIYNWLYTTRYPFFLDNDLSSEKELYERARDAISMKNKENLPEKYQRAFSNAYMDENKNASNEVDIVANCKEIYYEQIEIIIDKQPSIIELFKKKKNTNRVTKIETIIPYIPRIEIEYDEIKKFVEIYDDLNPKPKIKDFCISKGINIEHFKKARNKQTEKAKAKQTKLV